MLTELCAKIWDRPEFHTDYRALLHNSLASDLGQDLYPLQRKTLRRLIQSATHFSSSQDATHKLAAYRIASSSWKLYRNTYPSVGDLAALVFERLGNFPAISLLSKTDTFHPSRLPAPLCMELFGRELGNTVAFPDNRGSLILTDFQRRIWQSLSLGQSVAITAPTSTGKSFALQRFLAASLASQPDWGLYVVPSRALINQTSDSLRAIFEDVAQGKLSISSLPVPPSETGGDRGVYVLTQERLLLLLDSPEMPRFKLGVIDEAQMLGDGERGVLLHSVLERLHRELPEMQLLFGSPFTENPDIFRTLLKLERFKTLSATDSPVAQNLVFVDSNSTITNEVSIQAHVDGEVLDLGVRRLPQMLADEEQTLAALSWHFGRGGRNLVYAGGTSVCERIADKISQLAEPGPDSGQSQPPNTQLENFAQFVEEHVHPKYTLAKTIMTGVGFHYGRMPALIRRGVERLFVDGHLTHLVCTSTLLHGVNLPAKNLYLLNPTKGREFGDAADQPISGTDFWNLAGRAGRMGKEFEGNVYLINRAKWQSDPLSQPRYQKLNPSLDTSLLDEPQGFLTYVADDTRASGSNKTFENSFVKLFNELRAGTLSSSLDRIYRDRASERRKLESALEACSAKITVPPKITERHVNISVYRQQESTSTLRQK